MTVKFKITTKQSLKRLKLGMVSSFHPQCTCKRVEGYGKNWTHFVYKLDNLFRSIRFRTRTHLLHGHFIFLTYLNSRLFLSSVYTIHHSKWGHQFSTLSNIICYFQSFTDLLRELNDLEIENNYKKNSENVETWHGIIISPRIACAKE